LRSTKAISEYTIEQIDSLDKLKEIQKDWDRLYNLKNKITLFFSFEVVYRYYQTILANFKNAKINIFVIRNATQQIIAIFPFMYETKLFPSFLSLKELSLKNDYLLDFYFFLIDPSENQKEIFQQFMQFLKNRKEDWDLIKVNYIPEDEPLLKVFLSTFRKNYKIDSSEVKTLVIDCEGKFDEYDKKMDRKDKKDIRRQIHRLEREGVISIQEIKNPQDIEKGLRIFYDIEDSGWKGEGETSLKRSFYGEYFKELALHFSDRDKFRLYLLKVNDKDIAGIYAIIDQGIFYIVKTGYAENFSQYSPSKVLCYLLFERLFKDETIRKIDFYGPFLDYEKTFGKNTRIRYKITIANRKLLPTIYYIFLQVLKTLKYPFPEESLRGKLMMKLKKMY